MSLIPPPLHSMEWLTLFCNSRISANYDIVEGFQTIMKSLLSKFFLYCKISFGVIKCKDKGRTVHCVCPVVNWLRRVKKTNKWYIDMLTIKSLLSESVETIHCRGKDQNVFGKKCLINYQLLSATSLLDTIF